MSKKKHTPPQKEEVLNKTNKPDNGGSEVIKKVAYRLKKGVANVFIAGHIYTQKDNVEFSETKEVLRKAKLGYLEKVE